MTKLECGFCGGPCEFLCEALAPTAIKFDTVYRLSSHGDGGSDAPIIVVGTRTRHAPFYGTTVPRYEFLVNSPWFEQKRFFGGETRNTGDVIEVEDLESREQGLSRFFRFEPLTIPRWDEMSDDITGYPELSLQIRSDDELQDYYRQDYLLDSWQEYVPDALDEEKAFRTGYISHRADGNDWQKQHDGSWKRIGPTHKLTHGFDSTDDDGEDDGHSPSDVIPRHDRWKPKAEGLPDSTFHAHYREDPEHGWVPSEERQKQLRPVYKKIKAQLFRGRTPVEHPTALVTMGAPTSGKSSQIDKIMTTKNFVNADPDKIKEFMPEYQEGLRQGAENAADIVHLESGWLAEKVRDEAIRRKMNVVFQGVGRDPEYYGDMLDNFRDNGYRTHLAFVHVDETDEAVRRAKLRGQKRGRHVNEEYIRKVHPLMPKNFMAIKDKADDFSVFDANDFPSKLAWAREDGKEHVWDERHKARIQSQAATEAVGVVVPLPGITSAHEVGSVFGRMLDVDDAALEFQPIQFGEDQGVLWPEDLW